MLATNTYSGASVVSTGNTFLDCVEADRVGDRLAIVRV